ncbi:ganglioside GM2 activator-like [Convolutriloba macropyga]|uniref:ganglioside GM2 activator-like n=1 Tax=Convolutriloba macropyga TaxID=536237 RepID=UPI003F51E72F
MLARFGSLLLVLALAVQSDFINKGVGSKYGNIDVSKLAEHVKELRDEMKQKIKEKVEEVKDKAANRPPVLYNVMASSSDCDADLSTAIIHFDDLKFSPLTIQVPGNITVSAKVTLDKDLSAPITAVVSIKKRVLNWWVTVPCTSDNVGSCTYDDVCQYLPNEGKSDSEPCPKEFSDANLPCKCPVSKGRHILLNFFKSRCYIYKKQTAYCFFRLS